ncbi:MAG TPA: HEAT repeat domain-containing protein [Bryobacteraceae bacterium]|nr:HEAT repeat domain-containing protein [Bryobacteraceae bacterium]
MRPDFVRLVFFLLPVLAAAQAPSIGVIEIYGTRRVPEAEVRKQLGVTEGKPLPRSKGEVEERLSSMENIVAAHLQAACCESGKAILYVGIEERFAPHFEFHPEPAASDLRLPDDVLISYREFLGKARVAAQTRTGEDLTQGHSLFYDEEARKLQVNFVPLAEQHADILRKVVRSGSDPEERAIAAYLLGYAMNKAAVQDDLQWALRDSDETVRGNALRALAAFAVLAKVKPETKLRVSPTWMIEMLNSLVWTDRNNAAVALVTLTEDRDAGVLDQIRDRALGSVLQMARWRHLPHALPAFILAGRIAGVSEADLQAAWNREEREPLLEKAAATRPK